MMTLLFSLLVSSSFSSAAKVDFRKAVPACTSCKSITDILAKHSAATSPSKRVDYALELAAVIEKQKLKGKPLDDQHREVYFAINGTIEVLDDDFDSETIINLMDLRAQSPEAFDYVFWRFDKASQERIVQRMKAQKEDELRPKAEIPQIKIVKQDEP